MLYKKNLTSKLDSALFKNPTSEYRGTPFWSWNCKVGKEDVDHTLGVLKEMGMGGAHIHSRTGMDLPYLGEEFMEMVRHTHEKAQELGMLTWLYDEDRWPSGSAGGLVTKNQEYRMRFLLFSPKELPEKEEVPEEAGGSLAKPISSGVRKFLARYAVKLKNGYMTKYRLLEKDEPKPEGFHIWYLYREISGDNAWFNNQAYVDSLNPKAMDRFIELTHEAYYRKLGEDFGKSIPAIFTDEPQFCIKSTLGFGEEKKEVILPYTDDFAITYEKAYGCSFLDTFPECIWELVDGKVSVHRYRYHDHICERFASAFADNIGSWCRAHGIALTGHMMEEPTLQSQTAALGEAMRSYRSFDIPGIDMLCDWRELTTAKQAQSAVHQYGREGMLSELYGVTNWDFDFRGHKLAGDWQAALGVTIRVHHLTWTSMAGEAKRDYPASIGSQSPWYREYRCIEDYFSRLNTALTRGKADVRVGVIHPVESCWLYWGPKEQTAGIRKEMDYQFQKLTEWLLYGLIDFDFISESLWKEQTDDNALGGEGDFLVGEMKYDVILVPNLVTIRSSTLERLKAFQEKGGRVIFTGRIPSWVDALPSSEGARFADTCEKIGFSENLLLAALADVRCVDVHNQHGERVGNMLYQMRSDNGKKWLFLAHCNKMPNPDIPEREELTIKITGAYRPVLYDAMTGEIRNVSCQHLNGNTVIKETVYDHDSLLYALIPDKESASACEQEDMCPVEEGAASSRKQEDTCVVDEGAVSSYKQEDTCPVKREKTLRLPDFVEVSLEEPNVLILDIAEAKFDDGSWRSPEEILRIDNQFRVLAGYQLRTEAFPQPWVNPEKEEVKHRLGLRFHIHSEVPVKAPLLALENPEETFLYLNDKKVESEVTGYFADRSIKTVSLPDLKAGENILTAFMPYYRKCNVEAMYLLGDFGVKVAGRNTLLTEPVRRLAFGDICTQGLPFYGGNLTYRVPVSVEESGDLRVEVTQFRCPVIKVALDGRDQGRIAFSPYTLLLKDVTAGEHILELTAYGNRINTFGALHNCNHSLTWAGPDSWRTRGAAWSYEYQLRPTGIIVSPVVKM